MNARLQVILLVLAMSLQAMAAEKGSTGESKTYEQGGCFEVGFTPEGERKLTQIRAFLWNHWAEKKLGIIKVTYVSREGDANVTGYRIEPDRSGVWHICIEERVDIRGVRQGEPRRHIQRKYRSYTLERIVAKTSKDARLRFKDAKGRQLAEL